MEFELDHVFILTEEGAPAAEFLINKGLREGTSNIHPGQGTRNRRFFFCNAKMELLWVHNAAEARNDITSPTFLYPRWLQRTSGACPFGICLRPKTTHKGHFPFPGWAYQPQYLPQNFAIHVSDDATNLQQPFLFYLPHTHKPDNPPTAQPYVHAPGMKTIDQLILTMPHSVKAGPALQTLGDQGIAVLRHGDGYLMEVIFDGIAQALSFDARPVLPLVFHY